MRIEEEIKQSKFKSNTQKAYVNLIYTANYINSLSKSSFKQFDITHQQYNVLRILRGKYPAALNPGDIKAVMLDKSPDLTRLVDRILKSGLVERKQCDDNRRKVDIRITEKGLKFLERIDPVLEKNEVMNSENLTEDEAEQLSNLLDKLRG